MIQQKTLKNSVRATGIGLHSGAPVELRILPAEVDEGIVFRRMDLADTETIDARARNVIDTDMSTTLSNGRTRVATVEHLMAAFAGLGVDNAVVEVDSQELPIMDGSAAPYVFLLQSAGIVNQNKPRQFLRVLREVCHAEGDMLVRLEPYPGFQINYTLFYDHPVFENHNASVTLECGELTKEGEWDHAGVDRFRRVFEKEICRARTFGFLEDIERLRSRNLAQGGSLDNAVVMDNGSILNADGLRQKNEFVNHKILDAIGDLYLLGAPLIGAFTGHKSGHEANNRLLRSLLADPANFERTTLSARELSNAAAEFDR